HKSASLSPPTQLEIEWETGIGTGETQGDGHAGSNGGPIFPKWAWPSPGDRVWAVGHWIYDCGHFNKIAGTERAKSEIHPPIAIAAMRDQVMPLPDTGGAPVPVVATDLYIHGDGGWATTVLRTRYVTDVTPDSIWPIDRDYDFDIQLPKQPDP